jgi:hypothetical protein
MIFNEWALDTEQPYAASGYGFIEGLTCVADVEVIGMAVVHRGGCLYNPVPGL